MENQDFLTKKRVDGKWSVHRNGSRKANFVHKSQKQAWKEARRLARGSGSEAILLNDNGKELVRNSYNQDTISI